MPNENLINLEKLAGGELAEQINDGLQRVIENIADPNTNWKTKRKLTVELSFSADEKRNLANVTMEVKPKLAPAAPSTTRIIIDRNSNGKAVAAEYRHGNPGQLSMIIDEETGEIKGVDTIPAGLKVVK
ncbi:MAG: replication terminator protein [Desulfuromonadaceae bacterium]